MRTTGCLCTALLLSVFVACKDTTPSGDSSGVDADGDGFFFAQDCDDNDSAIHPAATEVCDGLDNNCDDLVDSDASDTLTWYADSDGDGYGDPDAPTLACELPSGHVADGSDCDDNNPGMHTGCFPSFSGATGSAWEMLTSPHKDTTALQGYLPAGRTALYNFPDALGERYDIATDTWTGLSNFAPYASSWTSIAPVGDDYWMIRQDTIYRYSPADDTWTTEGSITGDHSENMTESDELGVIYAYTREGDIVEYDTASGETTYTRPGIGHLTRTRLAYDPGSRALFYGSGQSAELYRLDLETRAISSVRSHPEGDLSTIFCSDRSGHIYAAGDNSGSTVYQYDIASDNWTAIPSLPYEHGANGSCLVSGDGYLYLGTGSQGDFYRLELY